jgi:hypothetical protein
MDEVSEVKQNNQQNEQQNRQQHRQQHQQQYAQQVFNRLEELIDYQNYLRNPRAKISSWRKDKIDKSEIDEDLLYTKKKYRSYATKMAKRSRPEFLPLHEEYKERLFNIIDRRQQELHPRKRKTQQSQQLVAYGYKKLKKHERELLGDSVLPSDLIINREELPNVEIKLYDIDINNMLDLERYKFKVEHGILPVDTIIAILVEKITVGLIRRIDEIGRGYNFYVYIFTKCIYTKNDEAIVFYITSLTHKREEAYVSMRRELYKVIKMCFSEIKERIYTTEGGESDLTFDSIDEVHVTFYRYHGNRLIHITQEPAPMGYKYRELPEWIRYSKSITNIQNNDDSCFKWCIARYFCQEEKNKFRITKKLREEAKKYDWFGLDDPNTFNEENLCKFEDYYNLRIIIFGINDEPGYYIRHLRNDKNNSKYTKIYLGHYIDHFFLIINLKGFIGCGMRKEINSTRSFYICESCFNVFWEEKALNKHIIKCTNSPPSYKLPKEKYLHFINYKHTLKYNVVCYADFEATTTPEKIQIPNSFCIFCPDLDILEVRYSDNTDNLFKEFWSILENIYAKVIERYEENAKLEDKNYYNSPDTICRFCRKDNIVLTKHYDRFTGKFISYACIQCHSKLSKPNKLRIFFHNLKGYDSHFIVKYGIKQYPQNKIQPLGKSKEKLFCIKIGKFVLLDSYCHLPFSLSQLIKDYVTEKKFAKFLPSWYTHKEAYPYEWFDNYDKLNSTKFPSIENFYSRLNNKTISEKEYQEALDIFNKHCKTFKDYHDIYLRGDVVLLAEVFEKYREISLLTYHLDPAWYVSGPAFFYDAMKYMTKSTLPLIQDQTLYDLIKSGIRGGICGIGEKSSAIATNNISILALDCVNLYGRAMMEPLPKEIIDYSRWIESKERFDSNRYENIKNKNPNKEILLLLNKARKDVGFIFCVDITLPYDLHDEFLAYPLFPEKRDGKLMQTLTNKEKYVVLDRYLRFGIERGYIVTKIHVIIEFKKEAYMKPYIEFNTEQRRVATEKKELSKVAYFKNANNMVFGKNIENPEKYSSYIIYKGERAVEYFNHPENYKDYIMIDDKEPIILFSQKRPSVHLNKPIIIGFCILDISKHIMSEHFYRLKRIYGNKMKLLYTDTDSFYLEIHMPEKEAIDLLRKYEEYFELPDSKIKKVPGKMALEKTCKTFRAFAAKHYIVDKDEKCKGVPKHCTTTERKETREYYQIKSEKHLVLLNKVVKRISYSDDKKIYISEDEIYPIGYKGTYYK